MAPDQSSVRLIPTADFDAKTTRLMMEYLRELKQANVFPNDKVRTSGSKDNLIAEYARLLRENAVDDDQIGGAPASTAAADAESSSLEAAREVFENILIHPKIGISEGTRASLKRLGAAKIYKLKRHDDLSEEMQPALQVTETVARILEEMTTGPDHSANYHRFKERLQTSFSDVPMATAFEALVKFCKGLGVVVDLDLGDEDQATIKEVGVELNVLSQAIERRLQEWSLTFPEPDPEDLTWPVDFYSDERSTMRNWIDKCMSEAAGSADSLDWRDTAMTDDDTEKVVELLLNRNDIPLEKARYRDTLRAALKDERTRQSHAESRSVTRSVSPKKRLSKSASPLKTTLDEGKKRGRELEAEEESHTPIQMQKRPRQSRGRGRIRESVGRSKVVFEAEGDAVEDEDEDSDDLDIQPRRRGKTQRRTIADDSDD